LWPGTDAGLYVSAWTVMDRSAFLKLLRERLPALNEAVNRQAGQLHFEIDVLRRCAQRAIFDGDREILSRCFAMAELGHKDGDKKLRNAIDVSFVEPLDFITSQHSYLWAWQMLPDPLKQLYEKFHDASKIPRAT
jgi:hypothetical protein